MKHCDALVDAGRRGFFLRTAKATVGVAASATLAATSAKADPPLALINYPATRLGNISDLKTNEPIVVAYPDHDSPGVLIKIGKSVEGGVGPDNDIVAFSTLCPHKGFRLFYAPQDQVLSCPGHYSRFDVEKGGLEIWGHATQNLAQFRLIVEPNGDIKAVSVDELIYGRLNNVLKS